ncbi:hypothetical protein ACVFI8_16965 [Agarivorans sp. MS3-6]
MSSFLTQLDRERLPYHLLLTQCQLPSADSVAANQGLVPTRLVCKFIECVVKRYDFVHLADTASQFTQLDDLGELGTRVQRQLNLKQSLQTLCEELPKFSSGCRFWLSIPEHGRWAWICRSGYSHQQIAAEQTQLEVFALKCLALVVQSALGKQWYPHAIYVKSAQTEVFQQCLAFARSEVHPGHNYTAMAIDKQFLATAMPPLKPQKNESLKIAEPGQSKCYLRRYAALIPTSASA